ncbi:MAG: DUF512 domain-containing protein [Clostridia bacterium]|nr:DUF512 domain-containing protein [Clostridia bacterium]
MAVTVCAVTKGSPAAQKGIQAGDRLLKINGHEINDGLDYRFYITEDRLQLSFRSGDDTRTRVITVEGEDPGLEFDTYLMDKQHSCRNKCVFCFIDQMPPGMRDSLYFKDDDSRLSFLFGNYITLTNLSEREGQRMIDMHISPVNVSVHTTNPTLREKMMGNRFAGKALDWLPRFAKAGLRLNCQLVLCPEWNDGAELERSLADLEQLMPSLASVAAVPVGLTKYRDGLAPLRLFTKEEAAAVIDTMTAFGDRMIETYGSRVVYPSDEFYLLADRPLPPPSFYEDFPQLENGVGVLSLQREEFLDALERRDTPAKAEKTIIATGTAAAPFISELVAEAKDRFPAIDCDVKAIRNDFFGESITVAGLVTGRDLIAQLRGADARRVLIPDCMLRHEGDCFLDDITLDEVSDALGMRVIPTAVSGYALLEAIMGDA